MENVCTIVRETFYFFLGYVWTLRGKLFKVKIVFLCYLLEFAFSFFVITGLSDNVFFHVCPLGRSVSR